ncbi:MAG: DUF4838 domain-containing protein [Planctomycetota bacterium]|jgi:hypothetical protein
MKRNIICKSGIALILGLLITAAVNAGEQFVVKEGKAAAEIVVAEKPLRMVAKAAEELQKYIKKISGAEFTIVSKPTSDELVKIYIGNSSFTDELGITDKDLKHGAFRIISGDRYLVLLGHDFDFEPKEPWASKHNDRKRALKDWDKITGSFYGNPMNSLFRKFHKESRLWFNDGAGSFNAVCEYLRTLGVRWYMPGELGEVVPQMQTIALPALKKTVVADYPLRRWFGAYFVYSEDTLMWDLHLGMNSGYQVLGTGMHVHGMRLILNRKEMFEKHPEYYAVGVDGKRDSHHACFSNAGLAKESAKFARIVYDHFDEPVVSLWPNDGIRKCLCAECSKFTTGELLCRFVDKVARDLYKTHPDKWVSFGAYSSYRTAPESIEKFPPNVMVFVASHRPGMDHPEKWKDQMDLINGWKKVTGPGRLIRNCNNYYDLVFHPRSFARELKRLKGISIGDWNEVRRGGIVFPDKRKGVAWYTPGIDHLNQYVNARFLWDADQDVEKILNEYYTLFYGPAAEDVKAAFNYAEKNYTRTGQAQFIDLEKRITFAERLVKGKEKAGESIYAKRIELILEGLKPLEQMKRNLELEKLRGEVTRYLRIMNLSGNNKWKDMRDTLVMDGKLDEPFWKIYPHGGRLKTAETGKNAPLNTKFICRWYKDQLVFGIHCQDVPGRKLNITTEKNNDKAILDGDRIEILLETNVNSYYRIVVNPAGALWDTNMAERVDVSGDWDSLAHAVAHKGEGFWSVEVKIPIINEEEGMTDPLHNVVGRYPTKSWPWFFNLGRVRVGEKGIEVFSYNKTGSQDLQSKISFVKLGARK